MLRSGIHTIPAERYHADPAPAPSLSASIAHLLCSRSPRHAWHAHPKLNPDHAPQPERKFDVGTAAHALLLDGDDICTVVEANDWRTKAAKEAAEAARADGRIPLLARDFDHVQALCAAVRDQLAAYEEGPPLLSDGKPEQTLVWQDDGGVWCRARADWLRDDFLAIDDLKTTTRNARPDDWARRQLWDLGADVQAAFYLRGLRKLTGAEAVFRWVVVEVAPPYALSVVSLAPSGLEFANEKVEWAIRTWRECLQRDEWPAYTTRIAHAELPAWEFERWATARYAEEVEAP